jgi:tRNA (cmo5U34)-methyltransferase
MSNVGDGLSADGGNWKFSGSVVDSFDDHVSKSVPLYNEGHELICDMSDFFIKSDSVCYEIGSSTGTLTFKLAEHNKSKTAARFIGIDIEEDMIAKAKDKVASNPALNVDFLVESQLI